jgi:hypothetical protein
VSPRRGIGVESRPPKITEFIPAATVGPQTDNALYRCERCRWIMGGREMRTHTLEACTERMAGLLHQAAGQIRVNGGSPVVDGGAFMWLYNQARAAHLL